MPDIGGFLNLIPWPRRGGGDGATGPRLGGRGPGYVDVDNLPEAVIAAREARERRENPPPPVSEPETRTPDQVLYAINVGAGSTRGKRKKKSKVTRTFERVYGYLNQFGRPEYPLGKMLEDFGTYYSYGGGIRAPRAARVTAYRSPAPGSPRAQRGAVGRVADALPGPNTRRAGSMRRARTTGNESSRAQRPGQGRRSAQSQQLDPLPMVRQGPAPGPAGTAVPEGNVEIVPHVANRTAEPGRVAEPARRPEPGRRTRSPGVERVPDVARAPLPTTAGQPVPRPVARPGAAARPARFLRAAAAAAAFLPSRTPRVGKGGFPQSPVAAPGSAANPIIGFAQALSPQPVPREALEEACDCEKPKKKRKPRAPRTTCKTGTYRQTARGVSYRPRATVPC